MGRRYLAGTAGEEPHCWAVAGTALSCGPSGLLPYLSLRAKTLLCISLVFSGLGILPVLPNPLEIILPSLGLFLRARISFLACLQSKQPLLLSFFSSKECINFLNISLCLKLDCRFPYLWPAQWCYTFPFLGSWCFFFSFFFSLCDLFLENVACSGCWLMLEKKIRQSTNWTQACFLFRDGHLFVLQPNLWISSKTLPSFLTPE